MGNLRAAQMKLEQSGVATQSDTPGSTDEIGPAMMSAGSN
ncbi:hypothetical protein MMON44395_00035 [Mycolicibacterium monacense DSM 44395]|nr:hypothetical protein [Mycolicibacterium monacense DSM 44395]